MSEGDAMSRGVAWSLEVAILTTICGCGCSDWYWSVEIDDAAVIGLASGLNEQVKANEVISIRYLIKVESGRT